MGAMALGRRTRHALLASLAAAMASFVLLLASVMLGSAAAHRVGLVLACLSAGGIGAAGAVHTLREELPVLRRWRRVPATVTACERDGAADHGYRIDVVYRPVHDRAFIGTLHMPRRRRAGARIRVRVDPADPGRIRRDVTLGGLAWAAALFCALGGLPVALAVQGVIGGLPNLR